MIIIIMIIIRKPATARYSNNNKRDHLTIPLQKSIDGTVTDVEHIKLTKVCSRQEKMNKKNTL